MLNFDNQLLRRFLLYQKTTEKALYTKTVRIRRSFFITSPCLLQFKKNIMNELQN